MTTRRCGAAVGIAILVLALAPIRAANAQGRASQLIREGRVQIDNLEWDSAYGYLQRALEPGVGATEAERVYAFTLLGIVELSRGNRFGGRDAFQQALRLDASLRIDSLAGLQTDVAVVFAEARLAVVPAAAAGPRAALAVEPSLPADTTVPAQGGRLRIEATPTYRSQVVITISPADAPGQIVWGDTQMVGGVRTTSWNLRGQGGAIVPPARYALRVYASDSVGQVSPTIQRILIVERVPADTLPLPPPLGRGDLLADTLHLRRGSPAGLALGLVLGAAAAVLPSALGASELNAGQGADGTAYAVAGAVSLAGIIGFLAGHRARPLPENIRYNRELHERDALNRQAIAEQNRRAREAADIRVRIEGAGP